MFIANIKKNNGFSLTELAVVVVIIAFILSAVLKGQNLINAAKIEAIVAEVSKNKVSITSFYNKYGKYPGDFNEAVANWGATTKDGDDDGKIEFINTLGTPTYEGYLAWQHLTYAQMTSDPYVGTATTGAAVPVTDIPASRIGGGFFLDYSSSATNYDHVTSGAYGFLAKNVMILGTPVATSASPVLVNGVMTPNQAMELDVKMDDGVPTTGRVRGADGSASTAGNCQATNIYVITKTGKDCIMIFKLAN